MAENPPYHGAEVAVDRFDGQNLFFVIRGQRQVLQATWGDEHALLSRDPTTVRPAAGSAGLLYLSHDFCAANGVDVRGMPKVPAYLGARRYHGKRARIVGMTTHFTIEGDTSGRVYSVDLGDRVHCAAQSGEAGGMTAVAGAVGEVGTIGLSDDWLDSNLVPR